MKPLETLLHLFNTRHQEIETWFEKQWQNLSPLPYFSCDLRHSNYKISIIDTNLFPGGFNNLCNAFSRETSLAFAHYFKAQHPQVKNIALFAEIHTRNKFYLQNLLKLQNLIIQAGLECRVTMPLPSWTNSQIKIDLSDSESLTLCQPVMSGGELILNGHKTDLILSNNDLSSGVPEILSQCTAPVVPPLKIGWHERSKSRHFTILCELIDTFCQEFNLEHWLFCALSKTVDNITTDNLDPLAEAVDKLINHIAEKFAAHGVTEEPYVFVKNDSGTYGLGVLPVKSGAEILELNRKKRDKLFARKGTNQINRFLLQEGVPTYDTYSGHPVEAVIYGVGKQAVGGFFRFHSEKNAFESLNAPGMEFSCLCLHKIDEPHEAEFVRCDEKNNLVTAARFLTRFAALAAAKEVQ